MMGSNETILVTGAGGHVGSWVVKGLHVAGAKVRAGGRSPGRLRLPEGVESVYVDLASPETLPAALAGVGKVFLYTVPSGIDAFVAAAAAAKVEHVVVLSSNTVEEDIPERKPIADMHRAVEEPLAESGIPFTFLRPAHFATNVLLWHWDKMIKATGRVRFPYPESHCDAIHERDIADVAVEALTGSGHEGQAYFITGPESVTQRRQCELIGAALGRPVPFEEITPEEARAQLGAFMPAWVMAPTLGYWAVSDGVPSPVTDLVPKLVGHPARSFAEWAIDHAGDFRA
jgi:uncharacterized protein YbjT (DUF2867 family)